MKKLMLLLVLLAQMGCTSISPQRQYEAGKNAIRLSERKFLVSYANATFPPSLVQTYLLRNCGETALKNGFSHFVILGSDDTQTIEVIKGERYPVRSAASLINDGQQNRVFEYEDGTREIISSNYRTSMSVEMIGLYQDEVQEQNVPFANNASLTAAYELKRPVEQEMNVRSWKVMGRITGGALALFMLAVLASLE